MAGKVTQESWMTPGQLLLFGYFEPCESCKKNSYEKPSVKNRNFGQSLPSNKHCLIECVSFFEEDISYIHKIRWGVVQ